MRLLHFSGKLRCGCTFLRSKSKSAGLFKVQPYSTRKFPELLYFPHIFRWLSAKLRFFYLRNAWDPEFTEGGFIYGSMGAICRITEIINNGDTHRLSPYLTNAAMLHLRGDMKHKLTKLQREIIRLQPGDIKLLVPMRVQLVMDKNNRKYCFVLLKSLAMKWYEGRHGVKLVLVVLETEFKRDYSEGVEPDWMINVFNVVQCVLIGGNNTIR